ncbi:MAG: Calx-beta domain-containing protein, partial [Planctomycetia bacterium]
GLDPRMGEVYRDYLRALDAAGLSLYMDFQLTGQPGPTPWGDFAKLHQMDEPLTTAHRYSAVVAAADGSLWSAAQTPPTITASVVDGSASEAGADPAVIRFTRIGATADPLTVLYSVAGTATPGADFAALAGSATFAAGATECDVTITPVDDTLVEATETVTVTLLDRTAYSIGGAGAGTVSLTSDDRPLPVVSVSSATITEGHAGRRLVRFTIALSGRHIVPVTVSWATSDETATAGRDYLAAGGRITFAPGQTRRTVGVAVLGDRLVETDETFRLNLATPVNATLSATASRGRGTIRNDDGGGRNTAAFASLGQTPAATSPAKPRRLFAPLR